MQKTKLSLFFSFFIFVLLICPVLAAEDEYGNKIGSIFVKEKVVGTLTNVGIVTNTTYSEPFNISMSDEPILFEVRCYLNQSISSYANISNTIAVGVTLEGDVTSEAGPLPNYITPVTSIDDFWYVQFYSDEIPISSEETAIAANFTLWLDYERNGTWTNTEYWLLNLQYPEAETYVPVTVNNLDFSFVWFWATVGAFFVTAISSGLAIRKISLGYGIMALFSGMFTYAFYQILAVGGS